MVVKMIRWRPWPPLMSKKFEVKLLLRRLEGLRGGGGGAEESGTRLMVEVRWKGSKNALSSLRRTVKRNFTREEEVKTGGGFTSSGGSSDDENENRINRGGVVEWNEEFRSLCALSVYKDNIFHPWEIAFTVFNVKNQGSKSKVHMIGTTSLNIAEFACAAGEEAIEMNVPVIVQGGGDTESRPTLCLSFNLLELQTPQEAPEAVQRPVTPGPVSPRSGECPLPEKDELSALKAGLRKVKIFKDYVSTRRAKKACREGEDSEGRSSSRSDDLYPFDSDSADDYEEGESEENRNGSNVRKSFSYGTLAHANFAGESCYSEMRINGDYEDWVYFSNRRSSDVGSLRTEDTTSSASEQSILQTSKRSILSWRKRKLSFRSPKAKGEPLLKKAYGEEGGDDIDFDRRQLNSSDESSSLGQWRKVDEGSTTNRSSVSEFGDDNFAVGSWEHKEVISRDGHMKLETPVFFASIDQRSERAAGESACTALVAVIADWFQTNLDIMPIKSQFDSLIREGSLEWRNLCENETYRARFPDKHFDLETVLQAKIRPLTVAPQKSFIGFFHPDGMEDGGFDFLQGAMSFDNIWDEISRSASEFSSNANPQIYIVSWNDHFFILKVEPEAYYIIDTLGERLYEGCDQAYILKFDKDTTIRQVTEESKLLEEKTYSNQQKSSEEKTASNQQKSAEEKSTTNQQIVSSTEANNEENMPGEESSSVAEEHVVCKGKEACKEYIKSFLAAIPIRELQVDIKKGLMESTPLHHRLQIEFHYTEFLQPTPALHTIEQPAPAPQTSEMAAAAAAATVAVIAAA